MCALPRNSVFAALRIKEIRYFLGSSALFTLAHRAAVVVIGLQVYKITHSALALGMLGLVEAVPAISLFLYGGHIADRFNRRAILLVTRAASTACAVCLAIISINAQAADMLKLYSVIFLAGIARGFSDPASTAFEAQVVPKTLTVNASSWIGTTTLTCAVVGPALAGFACEAFDIVNTYFIIAGLFLAAWFCTLKISVKPRPAVCDILSVKESILEGLRFVVKEQVLISSMVLDLLAVLFGGAVALLPVFAADILHVGARGLGLMEAAPALGALIVMLISTHRPPIRHAGRNLLLCVAGFGVSIIVFALSRNFILTLLALTASGIFDGISMVIRRSILRLLSPDRLRGRIASVNWIFISASNELGAFESGLLAHWAGVIPAVWMGGAAALFVAAATAILAPQLRKLGFNRESLERI